MKKKEQAQNEVKKNKKTLVIILIIVIIAVGALIAFVSGLFKTKEDPKDTETKEEIKKEENHTPPEKVPATNTEELKQTVAKIEVKEVTKDKIIFNAEAKVEVGEKVAVWVYTEPKFLGYFEVKEVNGQKIIEGLEKN